MKNRTIRLSGVIFLLGGLSQSIFGGEPSQLDGEWRLVSQSVRGNKTAELLCRGHSVVFAGDTAVFRFTQVGTHERVFESREKIHLGTGDHGKFIDFTSESDGKRVVERLGIYEISDGCLRICIAEPGGKRPAEFEAKNNENWILYEYKIVNKR